MGHAKGAKGDVGELARKLSSAAAHLLPVSGLSALLHAQMQDSFAFSGDKSTFHIHIGEEEEDAGPSLGSRGGGGGRWMC